jgi:hypothetical protein
MKTIVLTVAAFLAADSADPGYVLHEWGTFTTLAGSDGVLLEGIHADDHALPDFVHSREKSPEGYWGAMVKMETPVIYLYSDREREIRVKVDFPGGLFTTWYPQVRRLSPVVGADPPALKDGSLDWGTVKVLAPGLGTEKLPAVDPTDPWAFARVADANVLRLCIDGYEHEKFLFYRGLGRFDLPLKATLVDGKVAVEGAKSGRVVQVEGKRILTGLLGEALKETKIDDLVTTLAAEYACEGLTHPEALAMVRTWRKSWLETPGLRVLVPLARKDVDALLPLQVSPAPRESVRVLVARLDILTPAEERRAETVALTAATAAEAAEKLGRFAVPILRRVERTSKDPEAVRRAGEMARALEPRR